MDVERSAPAVELPPRGNKTRGLQPGCASSCSAQKKKKIEEFADSVLAGEKTTESPAH